VSRTISAGNIIWHATLYGMQHYMTCNIIWHATLYGKLQFMACNLIW